MLNHEETCEEFAQVLNVKYDAPIELSTDDDGHDAYWVIWHDGLDSAALRYCPFCGANLKEEGKS